MNILIADSGSTKCEWCLLYEGKKKKIDTQGLSPYFLDADGIGRVLDGELLPALGKRGVDRVFYYGTGCMNPDNRKIVTRALRRVFEDAEVHVTHHLMGAAVALCGTDKGIACILGTGSNSCYFDGRRIVKNSPGLGFVLG